MCGVVYTENGKDQSATENQASEHCHKRTIQKEINPLSSVIDSFLDLTCAVPD